jgi:hypothetical protein
MRFSPATPSKDRAIQSDVYETYGQPDFVFSIRRPFSPEDFAPLQDKLGIDPVGLANSNNQLFAENMANNMGARIKAIFKRNEELELAQSAGKRLDEVSEPLPTQDDMNELMRSYNFSGVRVSSGESSALTPFQREFYKLAKAQIYQIIKAYGVDDKQAPVSVARKDSTPRVDQITAERFAELIDDCVDGAGPWSTGRHAARREELIGLAEANIAATRLDREAKSLSLEPGIDEAA